MFFAIIKKEILLVRRDIHSLAVLFVMPMAFILIMSLSLQESFDAEKGKGKMLSVGLVFQSPADDKTPLGNALLNLDGFTIREYATHKAMTDAMPRDHLVAGLIVPTGLIAAISQNKKLAVVEQMQLYHAATSPNYVRQLIYYAANRTVVSIQLDTLLVSMTPNPVVRKVQKERFLGDKLLNENEWDDLLSSPDKTSLTSRTKPSSVQQTVPAWLIFSMFFVVIPIALTFLIEKQHGTFQRLKTISVPSGYLLVGKLIPYLGINLFQSLLMFLVGIYLVPIFGGEGLVLSGNAWLLIPMTIGVSFAAISFALFIATLVKSTEQATTIGGTSNLLLGAIGGVMVPTFVMPDMMQKIAQFSPMNWGLEGYLSILLKQGDIVSILPEMIKLLVFSMVFFIAATYLYRRTSVF